MKTVKSLDKSSLIIKKVSETVKNETKEQKRGFLRMLSDTLRASFSGDLLTGKGKIRAGKGAFRAGEGTVRAGQNF